MIFVIVFFLVVHVSKSQNCTASEAPLDTLLLALPWWFLRGHCTARQIEHLDCLTKKSCWQTTGGCSVTRVGVGPFAQRGLL